MAKDPRSERRARRSSDPNAAKPPSEQPRQEFADLYQDDVEFADDDFVEDEEDIIEAEVVEDEEDDEEPRDARRRGGRRDRGKAGTKPAAEHSQTDGDSPLHRLRERMKLRPVRPGEQDVLQSPVVLGLFGGTLLLALVAGTLWFIIGRQSSQTAYDAAQAALDEGRYVQAEQLFNEFVVDHSTHKLVGLARMGAGKAQIRGHVSGAAPDWPKGLEALQHFIRDFKDAEEYADQTEELKGYAQEIALGAARTAAQLRDRSLLEIPPQAMLIVKRFSGEEQPVELEQQVERLLIAATDAVVKQEVYDQAVANVEQALASSPPQPLAALHEREKLLARYPSVASNRKIQSLLAKTLETEKSLVTPQETAAAVPLMQDDLPSLPAPVVMTMHSRTRSDEQSEGRTVFALVKGCCYGVDSVTGEPIWRRAIGQETPFFPIPIPTANPGVLVFDTLRQEVVALAERTGELLWRLPIEDAAAGPPLIEGGQIYLASPSNQLYKIDLETGRLTGKLRFSQPLLTPPIATPDGEHLVAVGDRELIYTVALREFACVAVTHAGHKAGTVQAPITASVEAPLVGMGSLILLAENDQSDSSRLRVFSMSEPEKQIPQIAEVRIAGQVRDKPILRGNQLYVPSSGERISAFTVSDDPNKPPLTHLSTHALQTQHTGPMHLHAASDGQLWMATSALRRLENNAGTLAVVGEATAMGVSAQPIQRLSDHLFLGRHRPYSSAVLLTQFHLETLKSNWGLTLGSSLLAQTAAGDAVISVNEDGHVFRLAAADFEPAPQSTARFQSKPVVTLNLPNALEDPLGAVALGDGSLFAYAGGAESRVWFITPNGQLGRGFDVPAPLQTRPVVLRDGVVLPMEGRLRYVPLNPGGSRVDDYLVKLEVNAQNNRPPQWTHLEPLNGDQLIALDQAGNLIRIQFRTDPVQHLFEARKLPLDSPVNVPFAVFGEWIILADAARQLHVLDAQTFQSLGSLPLEGDATNALWMADGRLYVETDRSQLHAFELSPAPKKLWSLDLKDSGLAGAPLALGSVLLLAKQNGDAWTVETDTGTVQNRLALKQPLTATPFIFGNYVLVPGLDGSLHRIESLLTNGG